ncbi:hypothetical protein ACX93W_07095 [Paenibacillus sp. CAU 1782]
MEMIPIEAIQAARRVIEQDENDNFLLVIKPPASQEALPDLQSIRETLRSYMEYIKVANGLSLGGIVLFPFQELKELQSLLNFLPKWEEDWFLIGKIMSEPVGIQLSDGGVYWFSEIPFDDQGVYLGSFASFLSQYVFGEKYKKLAPWYEEEEWHDVLIKIGLST